MFALRRATAHALSQSSRLSCPALATSRSSIFAQSCPAFQRSFHQSIRWLSESSSTEPARDGDALSNVARGLGASQPQSKKIVFVGNLFFNATASQLEEEFSRYGTIVNTRVVTDDTGRSKGFGFIEFQSEDAAERAIKEGDAKTFQGRRMLVQMHMPRERAGLSEDRPAAPPSKTLFVGNMSFQMSDRDLNDLFREVKNVIDVRVAVDRKTGQPRGFAHADFTDLESAITAREQLKGKVVYGRALRVDFTRNANSYGNSAPRIQEEEDK